jgi:methyl-accepting chemotaxis protein
MLNLRRRVPEQPAVNSHTPPSSHPGLSEQDILSILDLLMNGRYLSVPEGDCDIGRKLHALAKSMHDQCLAHAKCVVDISLNTSESVTETAQMMREVTEVDSRAQSIAAAAEELVGSVNEISRNAEAAAAEAVTAQDIAYAGQQASSLAVETMENIARAVDEAAGRVQSLALASSQIGEIVSQIEDIASQTNLLALNATIEAARAGDAGKGFAVVANEVKSLANQTARATVDVRDRIENLRTEMAAIVTPMQEGSEAVNQGRGVIARTGEGMRDVNAKVDALAGRITDISGILTQQTAASREVSEAIASIGDMTQKNVQSITGVIRMLDSSDPIVADALARLGRNELKDFTIHVAKSDHLIWRKKLAEMLVGTLQLNPAELNDHHSCRLGKWCSHLDDGAITGHPAFQRLDAPHQAVHSHGIEAAKLYAKGDLDGAVREVEAAAEASKGVVQCLNELAVRR